MRRTSKLLVIVCMLFISIAIIVSEQQDNTAKAIEHYEKFLDLWKDADPGIAEVEDVRERLVGLKE